MSPILYLTSVLCLILTLKTSINCQNNNDSNSVNNSRMTKVVERHSENIRQFLCRGQGISPEQWANLKSECINPRINDLMPENGINVWQECSERVIDLCDDKLWTDGKDCAKNMFTEEDIREMQVWYRSRVRQMSNNFQVIKNCYQKQKKSA